MKIDLDKLDLPHLDKDVYSAVCSAIWHLNAGAPLSSAVRKASDKYGVPMARIERIIREALPANFFHKRQRASVKQHPSVKIANDGMMRHMRSL